MRSDYKNIKGGIKLLDIHFILQGKSPTQYLKVEMNKTKQSLLQTNTMEISAYYHNKQKILLIMGEW